MNRSSLIKHIFEKKSYLCIGLDPDLNLLPGSLGKSPKDLLDFNKRIIVFLINQTWLFMKVWVLPDGIYWKKRWPIFLLRILLLPMQKGVISAIPQVNMLQLFLII
jgi:hypothetical protein